MILTAEVGVAVGEGEAEAEAGADVALKMRDTTGQYFASKLKA